MSILQEFKICGSSFDEIIIDKDMISITLNTLPISYLDFQTSLRLSLRSSLEPLKFIELVVLLLQEDPTRESAKFSNDQANIAKFKKRGKKHSNAKKATFSKKKKDFSFCRYFKATDHLIESCPKLKSKEAKGKKKDENKSSSNVVANSEAKESTSFI